MWHIHTTEHYSAINRRGALIHTTIWMNPENTVLSEDSQAQRPHAVYFHSYGTSGKGRSTEQAGDCQGLAERGK